MGMVNLIIDGQEVQAREGSTVLEAAQQAGIYIPTLCFLKDINQIGACRVCLVEIEKHVVYSPLVHIQFLRVWWSELIQQKLGKPVRQLLN